MLELNAEEVAEYNGLNGAPIWVSLGNTIYNITHFPFTSDDERRILVQRSWGKVTLDANYRIDLINRLEPYKCGKVKRVKLEPLNQLFTYTPRMLRLHDNPRNGIYIAIHGLVYDVTDHLDSYPGGRTSLMRSGGVDRTADFPEGLFQGDNEDLLIGRMVDEGSMENVGKMHIVLHNWVYNFKKLETTDPAMYAALLPFAGTDATPTLTSPKSHQILGDLYLEHWDLIEGKITDDHINKEITTGELAQHAEDWTAWVSVDGYVYNITGIVAFPQYHDAHFPPELLGQRIDHVPELARWVATVHAYRRIGRLVEGPPSDPEPETRFVWKDENVSDAIRRFWEETEAERQAAKEAREAKKAKEAEEEVSQVPPEGYDEDVFKLPRYIR
ncbi:hypothetical protein F4820DRAFT_408985 [Hypoxylon rubiginosum]|uniref:Uncharacterized protein n=1 Tax=Hypoxylon rubiginosum TaxID=110542 RepID=A0ACB9ZBD7_9PEZI|nr:hypothetical protein F4820DRAFT_408985 [Hypoxylon rubiginosum]